MNSRERVERLLNREPVDRIPNGLCGTTTAGLHVVAYRRLKSLVNVDDGLNRMYNFMSTAIGEPGLLEAIEADIAVIGAMNLCPAPFWGRPAQGQWKDIELWGERIQVPRDWEYARDPDGAVWWKACRCNGNRDWTCPPGGLFFDPPPGHVDVEEGLRITPDDYHPPLDLPDEGLRSLEESARWLHENTSFALLCAPCTTHLELLIGGQEAWLIRLASDPTGVDEFLAKAVESAVAQLRLLDQAVGRYTLLHQVPDDMADRHGVMIGADRWREIYKPHYRNLFREWHRATRMRVLLHSCGAISDILDDLIECGVDVINPVQISARGMAPGELKKRFGDRIVFYGGSLDPVLTPPQTPPHEVYRRVRENILALGAGGGYIFAGQHNLPADTPASHLDAMLSAYRDVRVECVQSSPGEGSADD